MWTELLSNGLYLLASTSAQACSNLSSNSDSVSCCTWDTFLGEGEDVIVWPISDFLFTNSLIHKRTNGLETKYYVLAQQSTYNQCMLHLIFLTTILTMSHWVEARSTTHFVKLLKQTFLAPILKLLPQYFGYSLVQKLAGKYPADVALIGKKTGCVL